MKVLFDHQLFYQSHGGASKYFVMLINSMPRDSWRTTALFSCNEYVKAKKLFKTYNYHFKGQYRFFDAINRPYTNFCLRRGNFDVFHQTNFGTYCLKSLGRKPMVTTYHDSNFSTDIDPHPDLVEQQRISLERADAIICVSNNTKQDMLKYFDVDENKAHVIYHGIEIPELDSMDRERIFDFKYILYVGRRNVFKNFVRFITAFSLLSRKHPDVKVVCTSDSFSKEEYLLFKELGIENKVVHKYADEETMCRLYRDAELFVFPSLYEGFGMPILEAWSCRCPIVVSHASCFPEIAADCALYFDPFDVDNIYEKMLTCLEDSEIRKQLVMKGCIRVKQFSWDKCASEHLKVYSSLL